MTLSILKLVDGIDAPVVRKIDRVLILGVGLVTGEDKDSDGDSDDNPGDDSDDDIGNLTSLEYGGGDVFGRDVFGGDISDATVVNNLGLDISSGIVGCFDPWSTV